MFNRKNYWQKVYQDKSSLEFSWYQKKPSLSLEFINKTLITKEDAIIDVGGGASLLIDYLYNEGFTNLAVLDISKNALLSAKKRLGDSAKNIDWFDADITQFHTPHSFSLWHDRAVFHFLSNKSDRQSYIKILKQTVKPNGHVIIAVFAIGGPEKCSGLDIVQYNTEKLMAELGEDFTFIEEKNEVHITPNNTEQKFTYFRFIKTSP